MASSALEATVASWPSESSCGGSITSPSDFESRECLLDAKVTLAPVHGDIAWWNLVTDSPRDVSWEIVKVDSTVFREVKWEADISKELLWNSFDGLETSNLSRLARVVRDWSSVVIDELTVADGAREAVEAPGDFVLDGSFFALLDEANHKLLERKAGKELPTWFIDWRDWFLSQADRFKALGEEEIFNLLKLAVAARRSARRPRAPRQRHTPAERLLRLAKSIVPNAPPLPLRSEALLTGAG